LQSGALNSNPNPQEAPAELDPKSASVGLTDPHQGTPANGETFLPYLSFTSPAQMSTTYTVDGIRVPLDFFMQQFYMRYEGSVGALMAAAQASANNENYGRKWVRKGGYIDVSEQSCDEDIDENGVFRRTTHHIERQYLGNWETSAISRGGSWSFWATVVPQETYPGVMGNVRFVATDGTAVGDKRQKVFDQIHDMALSQRCNEMFRKAGLATPDALVQKGLIIGAASALYDSSNNAAFGISEAQRKDYKDLTTTSNPLLFIGGLTVQGKTFSDGRARIWFTADGMRKAFTETVIHELMHAAGAGRYDAWTGNDLKNFKQNEVTYQDIINACSKR
jgi:hypothetical protein